MSIERIEPGTPEWAMYFANHIHRYAFAANELKESGSRRVLDVACGVGYGARYLAEATLATVVAVDRDPGALRIAQTQFPHPGVTFVHDDCHTLVRCASRGPFDAVVSLETVEHVARPDVFLVRCRELLVAEGLLLLSTPNAARGGASGHTRSAHHEQEFMPSEVVALLGQAGFRDIALFGQRFTPLGAFRREVRAELNLLRFNPFVRLGQWVQRRARGRPRPLPALVEQATDFEIVAMGSACECESLGAAGPFVLICRARP